MALPNSSVPLTEVQKRVAELALRGVNVPELGSKPDFPEQPIFGGLKNTGTDIWLDTGDIDVADSLWNTHFSALTTNNTLLSNEVTKGIYDDLIKEAASQIRELDPDISEKDLVLEIGVLLNAHHGLRLVEKFHAKVSVELHTDLSHDFDRIVHTAHRLYDICPEYFIVKVPLTPTGLLAVRKLVKEEVPINFTLEFGARQNYVAARIGNPNFVNVFLGRLNAFVIDHKLGDGKFVGEKATLSSQNELIKLREAGDCHTYQIAASLRAADQVLTLAGLDVHTIPTAVADSFSKLDISPDDVTKDLNQELQINLSPGVDEKTAGLDKLWEVTDELRGVVDELCQKDLDSYSGSDFAAYFASNGFPDLFPAWTDDQLNAIQSDGKIPNYDRWKDDLKEGSVGLDALFNAAGLLSFSADQDKMDDQIRSVL